MIFQGHIEQVLINLKVTSQFQSEILFLMSLCNTAHIVPPSPSPPILVYIEKIRELGVETTQTMSWAFFFF